MAQFGLLKTGLSPTSVKMVVLSDHFSTTTSCTEKIIDSGIRARVQIPNCIEFIPATASWWKTNATRFPEQYQIPCNTLISGHIAPFPKAVRERLVELYCPVQSRETIKQSEQNQDCLIRPYLGRRRQLERNSRFKAFSLRSYPLHVDQMEEMGLNAVLYAQIMAETVAHLFWVTRIDACDIEFVLAPPPDDHPLRTSSVISSKVLGDHVLWILDFDCCREIEMDDLGVERAARAFLTNDRFYPRPGGDNANDQALWEEFKSRFLTLSRGM